MPSAEQVEQFLKEIREKMQFHPVGIVFRPRDKNMNTLSLLEIVPANRNEFIKKLTVDNYIGGPKKDNYDTKMPDYYEFVMDIKGHDIYIKLNINLPNKPVDCMSFHVAEFEEIIYPLKRKKK